MRIQIKGGVWKNSEDEILKAAVMKYGLNNWSRVASLLVRKSAKQCKARWYEWLDPSVKKTEWTRDEEEKLLHLAKLFPTQWRTIAPIVGRTAHQCLEHYEKLLDIAQGKDEAEIDASDPRRLRPGEIDPNPETKPSRADAVDMDDGEKEMLSEARARLANTRGKKAKRKAREKQLEEARRLASLQKRRELKAAGINVGAMRVKRKYIDYAREIPFEQQPPLGFHEVGAEETPSATSGFANVSLQQLEGKRRTDEENRHRKDDRRKLKRLQEDNLPYALQMIEKLNDPQTFIKRTKLSLPDPQLNDQDLEEIFKIGSDAANFPIAESEQATKALLGQYQQTPVLGSMRTPRRDNTVLMEAQNAIIRQTSVTPLEGGVNPDFNETQLGRGGATPDLSKLRTPNPLAANLGTPLSSIGGTTPKSVAHVGGSTPLRDDLSLNDDVDTDAINIKQKLEMTKTLVKSELLKLPLPQNEIEVSVPTLELQQPDGETPLVEDMQDVINRKLQQEARKQQEEWLLNTQVIRLGLPRPFSIDSVKIPDNTSKFEGLPYEQLADHDIMYMMLNLIKIDAMKFPIKGVKATDGNVSTIDVNLDELKNAELLLQNELENIKKLEHTHIPLNKTNLYNNAWEDALHHFIFVPSLNQYVSHQAATKAERVEAVRRQFGDISNHLLVLSKRRKVLEDKYNTLSLGYVKRAEAHLLQLKSLHEECSTLKIDFESFSTLRKQELSSANTRKAEIQKLIDWENAKNRIMQDRYAELKRVINSLNMCLTNASSIINTQSL